MKATANNNGSIDFSSIEGLETLSVMEMSAIRGGGSTDKIKTKDIDIYDMKEE